MALNTHAPQFELPHIPSMKAQGLDNGVLIALYLLGSTALRDFMQPIGATAYKAGLTARRYLDQKILDLGLRGYASIIAPANDRAHEIAKHPLSREWFLTRLPDPAADEAALELMRLLPDAVYRDGIIQFRLAPGLAIADVEKRFQAFLEPRNLNTFLSTDAGKKRLKKAGLPESARLFTDYNDIGRIRRSLACEIFLVRPQRELVVLLQALVLAIEAEREKAASVSLLKQA